MDKYTYIPKFVEIAVRNNFRYEPTLEEISLVYPDEQINEHHLLSITYKGENPTLARILKYINQARRLNYYTIIIPLDTYELFDPVEEHPTICPFEDAIRLYESDEFHNYYVFEIFAIASFNKLGTRHFPINFDAGFPVVLDSGRERFAIYFFEENFCGVVNELAGANKRVECYSDEKDAYNKFFAKYSDACVRRHSYGDHLPTLNTYAREDGILLLCYRFYYSSLYRSEFLVVDPKKVKSEEYLIRESRFFLEEVEDKKEFNLPELMLSVMAEEEDLRKRRK